MPHARRGHATDPHVLQECGRLLAIVPDQSTLSQDLDVVEASIASDHAQDWNRKEMSHSGCGCGDSGGARQRGNSRADG